MKTNPFQRDRYHTSRLTLRRVTSYLLLLTFTLLMFVLITTAVHAEDESKRIAFTFDDGPSAQTD